MKVKKILACVLAFVMLISAVPAVYAAGDDAGMSFLFDNTTPNPGDTITALVTVDSDFSAAMGYESHFYFDKELLTVEKIEILGTSVSNLTTVDKANTNGEIRFAEFNWDYDETIADNYVRNLKGNFARITLKVSEYAGGKTATGRTYGMAWDDMDENVVEWEGSYSLSVQGSATAKPTATGYTVSMGADQQLVSGQKVRIPVTVASSEKGITGFNAYDMTFTYDPAALTLNTTSNAAANLTVEDNNGTVRVRRYGDTVALGEALALEFTANKATSSTVTLTAAKFDLDANSINFDAPAATISDADTVVNANNFTVTLPDEFTSDAETRLVPSGGSFTFKPVDSHYTYTFTVKMGDTAKEGLTFGADDTYTIENISGNVVVTCTNKTPKQYDVTYKINTNVEQDVTRGPEKATYLKDYSFTVTPRAGITYDVSYSTPSTAGTTKILIPTVNDNGTITYTIPANRVVEDLRIYVRSSATEGIPVVITGNGAEDAASGNASSMGRNMPYYFTLNQRANCDYTVTAYYQPLNTPTASKRPATVRSLGNGKYVVEAVDYNDYLRSANHWNLVVNVEKVSHSAEEVTVSKYLELNDKTMMLITVKGTPEGGKAFTYDGTFMKKFNANDKDLAQLFTEYFAEAVHLSMLPPNDDVIAQSAGIKMFHIAMTMGYVKRNVLHENESKSATSQTIPSCTEEASSGFTATDTMQSNAFSTTAQVPVLRLYRFLTTFTVQSGPDKGKPLLDGNAVSDRDFLRAVMRADYSTIYGSCVKGKMRCVAILLS